LAILVRNQCRCIIAYHLGGNTNPYENGEAWFAKLVAPGASAVIDVGANVGNWIGMLLAALTPVTKVLLFDPSEEAVKILKHRFEKEHSVEIIGSAVGDTQGDVTFFEEPGAGEMSSLVKGISTEAAIERTVYLTTLDLEAEKRGLKYIDLIKVDAEGYDLHVLRGASRLLSSQRVGFIQFEYNASWSLAGSTLAAAISYLNSAGYSVFLLRPRKLVSLNYDRYGEYFAYSNLVAIAPDKLSIVRAYIADRM
jgi:FkbM family methyltransferase